MWESARARTASSVSNFRSESCERPNPKQPRDYLAQTQSLAAAREARLAAADESAGIGESSFIRPADLPFEFMLNALRLNEGFSMADYH